MSDIKDLTAAILKFRDERDWAQFHNAKDLAIALSVEASELLESFLWKHSDDVNLDTVKDELADVLIYGLLTADKLKLNVSDIVMEKLKRNGEKYPIDKAKGSSKKYDQL